MNRRTNDRLSFAKRALTATSLFFSTGAMAQGSATAEPQYLLYVL